MVGAPSGIAVFATQAQPLPAPELRPTKEQFAAQIEEIKQKSEAFEAESKRLKKIYDEADQAYRELREAQRDNRPDRDDARKDYHEAWDQVRQRLLEDAGKDVLADALKAAKDQSAKLKPKLEQNKQDADNQWLLNEQALQARSEAYDAYNFARQDASDYSRLLRSAQSTERRIDRDGVYETFVKEKNRVEATVASGQAHVQRLADLKALWAKSAEQWEQRWDEMTSAQQAIEAERLAVQLEGLRDQSKQLGERHDAKMKASRQSSDLRSELSAQARELRSKKSDLTLKVRELLREKEDTPERKAEIEQVEKELDETIASLTKQEADVSRQYEAYLKSLADVTEAYREWSILRKEVSVIYARHREASRQVAADPAAPKTSPRDREVQAIREAWSKVMGKDVKWSENPFNGSPIMTAGSVTQDGPDFKLFYDGPDYHAQMRLTNDGRTLHVFDGDAEVLYHGPVNDIKHLKDFSQELYYLWEFLYTQVNFR